MHGTHSNYVKLYEDALASLATSPRTDLPGGARVVELADQSIDTFACDYIAECRAPQWVFVTAAATTATVGPGVTAPAISLCMYASLDGTPAPSGTSTVPRGVKLVNRALAVYAVSDSVGALRTVATACDDAGSQQRCGIDDPAGPVMCACAGTSQERALTATGAADSVCTCSLRPSTSARIANPAGSVMCGAGSDSGDMANACLRSRL